MELFDNKLKFTRTMKSENELLEKLAEMEDHKAILHDQVINNTGIDNLVEWELAVKYYNEQVGYNDFLKWVLNIEED
jgi:hypothetical protein